MKVVDEIIESLHNGVSRNDKGFRDNCEKLIRKLIEDDRAEQLILHPVSKRFWHFDTWDKNGRTETITIEALNEENATIILKALHEDVAFDKPY
tara:strand:+ start:1479 stop:1760 length:282 start_codon:yes stop_codon:yes gene_type:complete